MPKKAFKMFPTYVGMNRDNNYCFGAVGNVPHVRGDEPSFKDGGVYALGCSPRTWG
ncbi:conserved hypothetical protein [uncultured Desulfobacterium sp.]|uniref:Uncharacterized protein n=1 Tax=uncultured Desulfobacterium sp. TaxID=201089 RepID=A0A445MSV6_9BACT|nr:conserved hypothetical protein [uncultured Desulfobacterium sp.]